MMGWGPKRYAVVLCCLILSACTPLAFGTTAPLPQVRLASGMVVAGPTGFCILPKSEKTLGGAEFVALAPCRASSATDTALLTATVGPAESAQGLDLGGPGLTGYFRSFAGLSALSRSGDPRMVKVHRVLGTGGATLIQMTDRSALPKAMAGRSEGWRALLALGTRLVTLSVQGRGDAALTAAAERRLIDQFVAAMRQANAGSQTL